MEAQTDPIAAAAKPIMSHVNGDHTDNLIEYLRAFTEVQDATDAQMIGIDRDGFDIEAVTPGGVRTARVPWPARLTERAQVREEMVRLTQQAQAKLGIESTVQEH